MVDRSSRARLFGARLSLRGVFARARPAQRLRRIFNRFVLYPLRRRPQNAVKKQSEGLMTSVILREGKARP